LAKLKKKEGAVKGAVKEMPEKALGHHEKGDT